MGRRLRRTQSSRRPLRSKLGIRPTAANIHLGHSIRSQVERAFPRTPGHHRRSDHRRCHRPRSAIQRQDAPVCRVGGRRRGRNAATYLAHGPGPAPEHPVGFPDPRAAWIGFHAANANGSPAGSWPKVLELCLGTATGADCWPKRSSQPYSVGTADSLHEFSNPLCRATTRWRCARDELGGTDRIQFVRWAAILRPFRPATPVRGRAADPCRGLDGVQKMSKSVGNPWASVATRSRCIRSWRNLPDAMVDELPPLLTLELNLTAADRPRTASARSDAPWRLPDGRPWPRLRRGGQAEPRPWAAGSGKLQRAGFSRTAEAPLPTFLAAVDSPLRAFSLLREWGFAPAARGRRADPGGPLRYGSIGDNHDPLQGLRRAEPGLRK